MHAKIENGIATEWPIINLRQVFHGISLPEDLTNDAALPDGYVYVNPAEPPAVGEGEKPVPSDPVLLGGKWQQGWAVVPLSGDDLSAIATADRERAKSARAAAVDAITVTTQAGNTFDGDEVSQTRMARAIVALQATGTVSTPWVLHDNSVILASAAELVEALALAGAAQSAVWVIA